MVFLRRFIEVYASFTAFREDADGVKARTASEKDGKLKFKVRIRAFAGALLSTSAQPAFLTT